MMGMRRPLVLLPALLALSALGCKPKRPDAPIDGVKTEKVKPLTEPLVVDWQGMDRQDLEDAMAQGVAVVSYDEDGLKLYKNCRVPGTYGYTGRTPEVDVVRLETATDLSVNLPVSGAQFAATIGAGFEQGTFVEIAMAPVGKLRTTWSEVTEEDLAGNCEGATHFVHGATVGAFVLQSVSGTAVGSTVEVLKVGAGAKRSANSKLFRQAGRYGDCEQSARGDKKMPGQCSALIRLELRAIGTRADAKIDPCPEGFVLSAGRCTEKVDDSVPYVCDPTDRAECQSQCTAGDGQSCANLGALDIAQQEFEKAAGNYAAACQLGNGEGCALTGFIQESAGVDLGLSREELVAVYEHSCALDFAAGCNAAGQHQWQLKQHEKAASQYATACDLGNDDGCSALGVLLVGNELGDPNYEFAGQLFRRACDGANPTGCVNYGYLAEFGRGMKKDVGLAAAAYEKACGLDGASCDFVGVFHQLGKGGKAKDGALALANYKKSCDAGNFFGCVLIDVLASESDEMAKHPEWGDTAQMQMQVWEETCKAGLERDCTSYAFVAIKLGVVDEGMEMMKTACDLGDDWACDSQTRIRPDEHRTAK